MSFLKKYIGNFDQSKFKILNDEMSFSEYVDLCHKNPKLARNSWQIIFDMIMAKGYKVVEEYRKTYKHYNFFDNAEYPIIGLTPTKDSLVKFIKGAAGHYGTEKRVLLLHGPVGSSKSTLCRLLKREMEKYSATNEGAWYTFKWVNLPTGQDGIYIKEEDECPMYEQPLKLLPPEVRSPIMEELNRIHFESVGENERSELYQLRCDGELDPRCKLFMTMLLKKYDGDLDKVLENHIRVIRKTYSESDRCGIATFQPKDEKNQDSTELTGDINFGRIGTFGADSDPRAFNFDGEFCVGNRGMIEFIEALKLDQAFLYDLLGASQEQSVKPKKYSQIAIDEAIVAHSVHPDTPIPHLYEGKLDVLPISKLVDLDIHKLFVFSVNEENGNVELTPVKNVFSHAYEGDWIVNKQDEDELITTPNHSVYDKNLNLFEPGIDTTSEIYRIEFPLQIILNYPKTDRWNDFYNTEYENKQTGT